LKKFAIIVAGGQGLRLGSEIPKQFLLVNNRPIIFYSIEKFSAVADEVILVLPTTHFEYWNQVCEQYKFTYTVRLVAGGKNRSESVINGLLQIEDDGVVAIHDAVRPLVTPALIDVVFETARIHGSAVPVIPMRESMRIRDSDQSRAVNRDDYFVVQTPQCFDLKAIKKAYHDFPEANLSDDASVFESANHPVRLVEGETSNIKITFREDLALADALLKML
jgi:2-C-methyl-D-erythritol 4-phosphate cytidylyltransferase